MLHLPDVTLVMTETREHELAQLAVRDCLRLVKFGDVLIFTDQPKWFDGQGRIIEVPDWPTKQGWCAHNMHGIAPHLRTSHTLGVQWDSWITDPEMWRDEYLEYDYIGGPWQYRDGMNVGDGGFSMRSTTLLHWLRKHRARFPCTNAMDDELVCRTYRPVLQEDGFEWAPESLAHQFSHAVSRDTSARMFGFHSLYSFWYGCGGDRERLAERVRIMARSKYLTQGRATLWNDFVRDNPEAAEALSA